jgi:hypothetical protein
MTGVSIPAPKMTVKMVGDDADPNGWRAIESRLLGYVFELSKGTKEGDK